jgi:hypothetical protein
LGVSVDRMIELVFPMHTIESPFYTNVTQFLRCFPVHIVSKFVGERRGLLHYI